MRYLSVCSGIEAASVAWHHLGWQPVGFSEIEPFPAAVLAHRFPNVPNYGDMTKFEEWPIERGTIDVLVGGTPCQSFSVAGLRQGLADPRGNLMLTYLAIADRLRPKWLVWENVTGVLSSNGGRDFGTFLGALVQLGYGFAYRVLDAQYVRVGRWPRAVPQRRRRVFVVGRLIERGARDWAAPGEVFALAEGLQRHLEARRAKGKGVAADAEGGVGVGCCGTVSSKWAKGTGGPAGDECYNLIAQPTAYRWQNDRDGLQQDDAVAALRASQGASGFHKMNHPVIAQPVRYDLFQITAPVNRQNRAPGDPCHTLAKDNAAHAAVAFHPTQDPISSTDGSTHCMGTGSSRGDATIAVAQSMTVRRLTPRECERLQGFPDDWTMIPYRGKPPEQCPDGPRYKALGNSMACNCMAWIGERIAAYEAQNGST
jgi:DNA (cytosine-5)-methyltransferase 1